LGIPFAAAAVPGAPSRQRYFCFIRRARDPVSRFKAFYETMPADTKYFVFEYYQPWLLDDVELFRQLLAAN
jgi:hypothetical protein